MGEYMSKYNPKSDSISSSFTKNTSEETCELILFLELVSKEFVPKNFELTTFLQARKELYDDLTSLTEIPELFLDDILLKCEQSNGEEFWDNLYLLKVYLQVHNNELRTFDASTAKRVLSVIKVAVEREGALADELQERMQSFEGVRDMLGRTNFVDFHVLKCIFTRKDLIALRTQLCAALKQINGLHARLFVQNRIHAYTEETDWVTVFTLMQDELVRDNIGILGDSSKILLRWYKQHALKFIDDNLYSLLLQVVFSGGFVNKVPGLDRTVLEGIKQTLDTFNVSYFELNEVLDIV